MKSCMLYQLSQPSALKNGHFILKDVFIYLREKDRQREHMCAQVGRCRGRRKKNPLADFLLSTEPNTRLDPTTLRPQLELKPRASRSTDWVIQAPPKMDIFDNILQLWVLLPSLPQWDYFIICLLTGWIIFLPHCYTADVVPQGGTTLGMLIVTLSLRPHPALKLH